MTVATVNDFSGSKQKQFGVLQFLVVHANEVVKPEALESAAGVSYWRTIVKDFIDFGFDINILRDGRNVKGYTYKDSKNNLSLYASWIDDARAQMKGVKSGTTKSLAVKPKKVKGGVPDTSASHFPAASSATTLSAEPEAQPLAEVDAQLAQVIPFQRKHVLVGESNHLDGSLVPLHLDTFVPFGIYDMVKQVIAKGIFFPVFVSGLSGNGKTLSVEQACAVLARECIRVQITPETDEDDLIGGYRLINGETVWCDGPVVIAAIRGAICLIDEIDYGTGKISCLQGILEGKGIFIKKANRLITPKAGFNIIATANTKGRGSEEFSGRYVNTNIMNEAFLERFALTLEQDYPNQKIEKKILLKQFRSHLVDEQAAEQYSTELTSWASTIRISFQANAIEDVITTRRLSHIVNAYSIFGDIKKAVALCVSRFDGETRDQFIELFDKVHVDSVPTAGAQGQPDVTFPTTQVGALTTTLSQHGASQFAFFLQQIGADQSDTALVGKVLTFTTVMKNINWDNVQSISSTVQSDGSLTLEVVGSNQQVSLTIGEITQAI